MELESLKNIFAVVAGVIGVLNFVGIIVVFVANRLAFHKIMTNDLHHVNENIKNLSDEQKGLREKVGSLAEDMSYVKGALKIGRSSKTKRVAAKK
jgi:hypothetical protein